VSLFQLSNLPDSPQKRRQDPSEEEDDYDAKCYEENAGAEDSEEEDEVQVNDGKRGFPTDDDHEHEQAAHLNDYTEIKKEPGLNEQFCYGAPIGWKPPTDPPKDWKERKRNAQKGEPEFNKVDNPGNWSSFAFQPRFARANGKYVRHALPAGAEPVPEDDNGVRKVGDWTFHYQGWKNDERARTFRNGATKGNMFPKSRSGSLDQAKLLRAGLTKERMEDPVSRLPDALFFYFLLLPVHLIDSEKGMCPYEGDPRTPFYTNVSKHTNLYAVGELELCTGYGHKFETTTPAELARWDGVLVMDGVRGSSNGAILRRWDQHYGSKSYDEDISKAMTKSRWLELKRTVKLCNNLTAPQKGEPGYNPAYKYDMIFDVLVKNINAFTLYACLDQAGDETSFGHQGMGEPGSNLCKRIMGKPRITKGMQTVITSDVDWIRIRSYVHRHKCHPQLFSLQGPNEVRLLWETQMLPMCQPDNQLLGRALFSEKPHFTFDNFFSGDEITSYAAEMGFGLTVTCRRDRLPKGVPGKYFHKEKTPVGPRSRAARFEQPIVAKRTIGQSVITHTSFQSTSGCNFTSVNGLNECSLYAKTKERGRQKHKQQWGIEMNDARELYLNSYGVIDKLDHLIQNCNMRYRSWKHWHSAMCHAKAMTVTVAYDFYLECATGNLAPEWKTSPVSFYTFREQLARQMLHCSPKDLKHPGDEKMRASTQQPKKNRPKPSHASSSSSSSVRTRLSTSTGMNEEKLSEAGDRLCGFLDDALVHERSMEKLPGKSHQVCRCCGKAAYHVCTACPGRPALHIHTPKDRKNSCFLHYHNTSTFGQWKEDFKITGNRRRKWKYPDDASLENSRKEIKNLHEAIIESRNQTTAVATLPEGWNHHVI